MNKLHDQQLINRIVQIIKDYIHPQKIILFGSRVTDNYRRYSDFDIAVENVEMDIRKERLVKEALDNELGIYTVDLINLNKVDVEFKKLILAKGTVIYGN
jgi:predicted nucleotidyltransferase